MSIRIIVAIVFFGVGLSAVVLGGWFMTMMVGELNRKRPHDSQISHFGFTLPKLVRIIGEYRLTYPAGKLHLYYIFCIGCVVIGMMGVALCLFTIG